VIPSAASRGNRTSTFWVETSKKEENKDMLYTKPELVVAGNAIEAVKGENVKDGCTTDIDNPNHHLSNGCAYESDE
jgi:hypothetical protein